MLSAQEWFLKCSRLQEGRHLDKGSSDKKDEDVDYHDSSLDEGEESKSDIHFASTHFAI